jgi:hypothetical protein
MPTNIEKIVELCEELGLDARVVSSRVIMEYGDDDQTWRVFVHVREDGRLLKACASGFIESEAVQASQYKFELMYYLLHLGWRTPFGSCELDPDGDLRCVVEVPLADNHITRDQFKMVIDGLNHFVKLVATDGLKLIQTGIFPSD